MIEQEQEGVIKFKMTYTQANPLPADQLAELNAWRKVMVLMGMIGQSPYRYTGYGFGNISRRLTAADRLADQLADPNEFLISGTQTGGIHDLKPEHYAKILSCNGVENHVIAEGPMKPSSESMTHGMVYQLDPAAQWVFHAHDPYIWTHAKALGVPETGIDVEYGSPEMSAEVERLFHDGLVQEQKIFSMAGHLDGIVTFGATAEEAGAVLMNYLAKAIVIDSAK
ncbi:MAG: ribulose-5-phosphate 4-epimerase/fuculose-1-phosphate aldolase [Cellvibrionaceae bacterium]|jgi:ribulose-5-phosphate 4-epimerase/fuculose-1-phosphate aldolase